jgi:CHRD domain
VFASHDFAANLTGQQEVPSVDTKATGEAIFIPVIPFNETIDFYVNTTAIKAATRGHIHIGAQGENGPIIVTLLNYTSPQDTVTEKHRFTASNLEGPMQGKTIEGLRNAMQNGTTYVNIHTEQNLNGEIRGQIK